jgi:endonuclease I/V8-like Glu-specific endopeptidase
MNYNLEIARQAAERWRQHNAERERNEEKIKSGEIADIEPQSRIKARLERLSMNVAREQMRVAEVMTAAAEAGTGTSGAATSLVERIGFERVIGKADFLNVSFLELALAVSRFVGRINIKLSRTQSVGFGTGFMVSPRLLLTNNHVLQTKQDTLYSEVEFDYQYDRFGRLLPVVNYSLEPDTFFITNRNLDFTLVAVSDNSVRGDVELKTYGWNRLIGEEGKALIGDSLNIIQHPRGEAKQISFRSNQLLNLLDDFAHYETDTEPGSSGSPVYNDQWETVALHHSGVPKMQNGQLIAIDGSVWHDGIDDPHKLAWVANEGIRISRIVNYIKQQNLSSEETNLRRELLELEPPHPVVAAIRAEEEAKRRKGVQGQSFFVSPIDGNSQSGNLQIAGGAVSFTVPLQITVQLGIAQTPTAAIPTSPANGTAADSVHTGGGQLAGTNTGGGKSLGGGLTVDKAPVDSSEPLDSPELREALAELEVSRRRPYYDEDADTEARDEYYKDVAADELNEQKLFQALSELLKRTHQNKINYRPATHVYPWVELRETSSQLKLKSIYSGREFNAQDFIEADFRVEQERSKLREMLMRESSFNAMEQERQLNLLEASLPFNCEHVVPQSWFAKKEPMRGDLHHLFACEVGCNSFRSNIPYYDFPDFEEAVREACGKREENKFEPMAGKGVVARATLYFILRYPGEINQTAKEYTADRLQALLKWHRNNPVERYEKHRNAAIQEKQGNRNPLIDFPEWADRIDFTPGLG